MSDEAEMVRLAKEAVDKGWSVREVEARARGEAPQPAAKTTDTVAPASAQRERPQPKMASAEVRRVEDALRKRLGTDARVTSRRRGRGFISISYYSNDDLARVLELILGEPYAG
jgi:ParB family chromosome partitioning protein